MELTDADQKQLRRYSQEAKYQDLPFYCAFRKYKVKKYLNDDLPV